jgi:hypothetical protein
VGYPNTMVAIGKRLVQVGKDSQAGRFSQEHKGSPTFISASFVPSLFGWNRKVYSGRREADLVMSTAIAQLDGEKP